MQRIQLSLTKIPSLRRLVSTLPSFEFTALAQSITNTSTTSSARDIFSHQRLNVSDLRNLDLYAQIAFRESPEYKTKYETWNEIVSNENDYIYRYIHKRLHDRFSDVGKAAENLAVYSNLESLRRLCHQVPSREVRSRFHLPEITEILSEIRSHIEVMNQLELASFLTVIKSNNDQEFRIIKRMIDMELRWLLKKHVKTRLMDLDLWLYLADTFYECKMNSTFIHVLLNYMTAEPDVHMSNRQLIHMLFLIIIKRQQDGLLEKYEQRIYNLLSKAPFEEISVISLAYFKTKTPFTNHMLLKRVIERTIDHLPNIDPYQPGYAAVIKSLRYSRQPEVRENVVSLTSELMNEQNKRIIFAGPYNAVQTVKLMESYRIYDPSLLNKYWAYMMQELDKFRIKDIQYALTSLTNFAYQDLNLSKTKFDDLDKVAKKAIELANSGTKATKYSISHALPLARALAVFGYYNNELIEYASKCLNEPDKLLRSRSVIEFERSVLLVRTATHLECKGAKLETNAETLQIVSNNIDRTIGNVGSVKSNSLSHLDHILRGAEQQNKFPIYARFKDIALTLARLEEFSGPEYEFNFQYTMPHQNYVDLVVTRGTGNVGCFDPKTQLPRPVPRNERHVIIFGVHRMDYIDGYERLSGYKRFVIRLLERLGYSVITTNMNNPDIPELSKIIKLKLDQQ